MEKRPFPVFPRVAFAISVCCMIGVAIWFIELVHGYIDMSGEVHAGHEWLPLYFWAFMIAPVGVVGAISSAFCGIKATITWVKVVSFIMLAIFLAVSLPQIFILARFAILNALHSWGLL